MRLLSAAEQGDLNELRGLTGGYVRLLRRLLRRPLLVLAGAVAIALGVYAAYGAFGRGIEFFPEVEPQVARLQIHARGNLSARERDQLVRQLEERILDVDGIDKIYARSAVNFRNQDVDEDVIGIVLLEFEDWQARRPASEILAEIRARTDELAGIQLEVRKGEAGPPVGKPIQVQLSSRAPAKLDPLVADLRAHLDQMPGLVDVTDSRPVPGIEWRIRIDREQAGRFGADIALVGSFVQLVTNGILIGDYRPDDADDEVDIRARFPGRRALARPVRAPAGQHALRRGADRELRRAHARRRGSARSQRVDGRRQLTVSADVADGVLVDDKVQEIRAWLAAQDLDPAISVAFKGEDEEQKESQAFLSRAFVIALFLIAIILVTQFNSFYQTLLILSAVVFSTVGVLLGLLVTQQPFGIVMSGVGVIALAGIVVNNNIVLIDTYNELRKRGLAPFDAVLRTGAQRLRPVLLTTVTTILGLLPMVLKVNVDLLTRTVTVGGPSTDWWSQLASAVAGGLAFATVLTLVLTPCLLLLGARTSSWLAARRARGGDRAAPSDAPDFAPQPAE